MSVNAFRDDGGAFVFNVTARCMLNIQNCSSALSLITKGGDSLSIEQRKTDGNY